MDRRAFLGRARRAASPPLPHTTVAADLAPYAGPWGTRQASHLVRRTHVGATRADVVSALTRQSASAAVGALLAQADARPLPDTPRWASRTTTSDGTNTEWLYEWQRGWYAEMMDGALREKLLLFWHDHFATGHDVYYHAAFAVDYLTFLRERATGPLRPMLEGIATRPAMLRFLDNDTNRVGSINENYAREVLELFSMGISDPSGAANYTQDDIVEAARALTGWTVDEGRIEGRFDAERHDAGDKTLFGETKAWDAPGVVEAIFKHRSAQTAQFVAAKLYAWFVHPVPNAGVVAALAARLQATDFDTAAVIGELLSSAHFYSDNVIGARIKSPMELMLGLMRELEVTPSQDALERVRVVSQALGQEVLNPPSVEGWPGYDDALEYRSWITTGTIPARRGVADEVIYGDGAFARLDPLPLVERLSDTFDPYQLTRDLADHLLAVPLSDADVDALAEATVLDSVPTSYTRRERQGFWTEIVVSAEDVARDRVRALLSALVNLPEYQLV